MVDMAKEEKFESVTLTRGDEVRVADSPASLVQYKWDGFVEKDAAETKTEEKPKGRSTATNTNK